MSTVTTYPDCPCCRPASGSGSGSGSGGIGRPIALPCLPGVSLPDTLYLTFTGALAALGTIAVPYRADLSAADTRVYQPYSDAGHVVPSCYTFSPNYWTVQLQFCTISGRPTYFFVKAVTFLSRCLFTNGSLAGSPVASFVPFYAEYDGTVTDSGSGLCDCNTAAASVVVTDTPP